MENTEHLKDSPIRELKDLGFYNMFNYRPSDIKKKHDPFSENGQDISESEIISEREFKLMEESLSKLGCVGINYMINSTYQEIFCYFVVNEDVKRKYRFFRKGGDEELWKGSLTEITGFAEKLGDRRDKIIGVRRMDPDQFLTNVKWDIEQFDK